MNDFSDEQKLLIKISCGEQQAFRLLFDRYSKKLVQFSFSIVRAKDAAIEITDEVFARFWKNRQQAAQIQSISVYLYTAIKNASLNYLAQKARLHITEAFDSISIHLASEQNPEQKMITAEIFKKIQDAVDALPPRCRMIFKLVREDGLKYKEVAEILNISVNTVDAQMVIAIRRICDKVQAHFDGFPKTTQQKNMLQ
jgi:RNA polymerase sigma-70 factor (ECF subfamily)